MPVNKLWTDEARRTVNIKCSAQNIDESFEWQKFESIIEAGEKALYVQVNTCSESFASN